MIIRWEDDPELTKQADSVGKMGWVGMEFSDGWVAFVHESGFKSWFELEQLTPALKDILKRKFPEVLL